MVHERGGNLSRQHTVPEVKDHYDTPEALAEVAARYITEAVQVIEATLPEDQRRPDMLRLKLEVAQTVALFGILSALHEEADATWSPDDDDDDAPRGAQPGGRPRDDGGGDDG